MTGPKNREFAPWCFCCPRQADPQYWPFCNMSTHNLSPFGLELRPLTLAYNPSLAKDKVMPKIQVKGQMVQTFERLEWLSLQADRQHTDATKCIVSLLHSRWREGLKGASLLNVHWVHGLAVSVGLARSLPCHCHMHTWHLQRQARDGPIPEFCRYWPLPIPPILDRQLFWLADTEKSAHMLIFPILISAHP